MDPDIASLLVFALLVLALLLERGIHHHLADGTLGNQDLS